MRSDEIDARIDAALRSYAEPPQMPNSRVVLARVLERARAEKVRPWRWWACLIPVAGCAVAFFVAAIWVLRAPNGPQIVWTPHPPGAVNVAITRAQPPPRRRVMRSNSVPGIEAAAEKLPKLETFPAPAPATAEEQKLVAFAQRGPWAAKQQVVEARQHADDPLEIAELNIQPLDEGDDSAQPKGKEKP
jgi:hypothetical protein